jgi:putative ABC transport system permease protein
MSSLLQDIRFALRQARSRPGFTLVVILVLALGLGANAAIFSVVNVVLLHTLPYPNPDRLVLLWERGVGAASGGPNVASMPNFLDWQAQSRSFEHMAAARQNEFNLGGDHGFAPERLEGAICSWSLFPALGVQPFLGRDFRPEEDRQGAERVAIISYGLWQRRFGGASDILQHSIRLDDQSYQVIGVMPRGFSYPRRGMEVWAPIQNVLSKDTLTNRGDHEFYVVARLLPGVAMEKARDELDSIQRGIWETNGKGLFGRGAAVSTLDEAMVENSQTTLRLLFGAVACVLLIGCVNVANLLLARGAQRQREVAIRAALGAGWGRLVRQLLTEALLLSTAGAAAGLLLASYLTSFLARRAAMLQGPTDFETSGEIRLDIWVFLFTTAIALVVGLATGIVPALQAARADLTVRLKDNSRSTTASRGHARFRHALVAVEVALSLLLLVSAGLLLRSFLALRNVHPGVRTDHILTAGLSLPEARYAKREQVATFSHQLLDRLRAVPGVQSAGLVSCLPVGGYCGATAFWIEGRPLPPGQFLIALHRAASPDYFATAGIPMLRGRTFTDRDGLGFDDQHMHTSAVVISQSMAHEFWPNEDPIGKRIYFGDEKSPRFEVIGICGDVVISLDDHPRPTVYQPIFDGSWTDFYAVVRTAPAPQGMASVVRGEVNRLDASLPVFDVRTMQDVLQESAAQRQFTAGLVGCFALLALVLAAVGIYGVLYYIVAQRTNEIGIRVVLGASSAQVRRLILWQGMRPVLIGAVLGLVASVAATRYFESLLFGVHAGDPATFVWVTAVLLGVALFACSVPAIRATRVDPAVALRME